MAPTRTLSLMLLATWLAAPAAAQGIAWRSDVEAAKREAAASGRLVLLHFSGPNCQPCRAMEQTVFNRPDVAQTVEQSYVPVSVDTKDNPGLAQQYGVRPIPADVIVGPDGRMINKSVGANRRKTTWQPCALRAGWRRGPQVADKPPGIQDQQATAGRRSNPAWQWPSR